MKIPKFEAQTEWVKPTEFPDLRQVDEIAIDLETKDPDLIKKGSGSGGRMIVSLESTVILPK